MENRPAGSYIQDPETGALTPNLNDEAMRNRLEESAVIDQSQGQEQPSTTKKSRKGVEDNATT